MALKMIASELLHLAEELNCQVAINIVKAVSGALERSSFHVAVLGEFKRGKSSLINSLLGMELLPADILPATATINVVQYGLENSCTVFFTNGEQEKYPLDEIQLTRLCVDGDIEATSVRYVLIEINNDLLQNGMVFIDTPGVNDISQSRIEVTHNILPHCDAALFLLDAVAPLTRSEADFLTTKVLSTSLSSLLFVISKSDRLDEDELIESIEGANERLSGVICRLVKVIPYSPRRQMLAMKKGQSESQYINLCNELKQLRDEADSKKYVRSNERLKLVARLLIDEINIIEALNKSTEEQLVDYQRNVEDSKLKQDVLFNQFILNSEKVGRQTLTQLFVKSCGHLLKTTIADIEYQLRLFEGDVENMWQRQVPILIERRLRQFAEEKGQEMQQFLVNFTDHLTNEYQRVFDIPLKTKLEDQGIILPEWRADIQNNDNRVQRVVRDIMPFTVGAVLGTLFMPGIGTIAGSAVGSVLHKITSVNRISSLKEELLCQLPVMVEAVIISYRKKTLENIDKWFDDLRDVLHEYHKQQKCQLTQRIETAIQRPEEKKIVDSARLAAIKQYVEELNFGGEV